MKTLTISKTHLIKALKQRAHVAASYDEWPWMIAVDHNEAEPTGRIIWADTPSSNGGYFANFVGEENYAPELFVYDDQDISWEDGEDDDAELFIGCSLVNQVELDAHQYKVEFN